MLNASLVMKLQYLFLQADGLKGYYNTQLFCFASLKLKLKIHKYIPPLYNIIR
jgi:hypothetical protein